jgi:TctA family transporter
MLGKHLALTFSMFWIVVVANIITVAFCLLFVNRIARITLVKSTLLIPFIVFLIYLGGFTAHNAFADLVVVVVFGFIGTVMVWLDWPRPPLVLGLVLGNWAENYLYISTERFGLTWLARPLVIVFLVLTFAAIVYPLLRRQVTKHGESAAA